MDYKGYHIEEEKPGQFMVYQNYDDWRSGKDPLNVSSSGSGAIDFVDSLISGKKILIIKPFVLYHTTTLDTYQEEISRIGLVPQSLREDVAAILGFKKGTYLANNVGDVRDLASKYMKSRPGNYVILCIEVPPGIKLFIDPEIGEPDSPWFITPDAILPKYIVLLDVLA